MSTVPKFTIVISGYKTEPYLPKCLETIRFQTFTNFEVICYVEESSDNSFEICRNMSLNDERFIVVTPAPPKSGSVSNTRNYGIDHAKGEYLVVVDGDDWVTRDMLEKLNNKLQETDSVDILAFAAFETENENESLDNAKIITNFIESDAHDVMTGADAIRRAWHHGSGVTFHNYSWLNVYRVDFLREHKLYQRSGMRLQDQEHTPRAWFLAKRFAYLNEPLYIYRKRAMSVTTDGSKQNTYDLFSNFRSILTFIDSHAIPNDILAIWSNQWLSRLYWALFHPITSRRLTNKDREECLEFFFSKECKTLFRKFVFCASFSKRIAYPVVFLASKGFHLPAALFFHLVFYPLIDFRNKVGG